jgi:hypothetical protein
MIDPKLQRIARPRHLLCKRNQRKVSHLSLVQSFGASHHDDTSEHLDQAHQPMPKGQLPLALLAQVLGDL